MKNKIIVNDKADREQIALILVKAGYSVKISKVKLPNTSKYIYQVEYEGNGEV